MYSRLPAFVYGFHGCDQEVKEKILRTKTMDPSQNEYDWLGHGFYFWEQNQQRALDFANVATVRRQITRGKISTPAVVGAVIDLGNCLNILDANGIRIVEQAYEILSEAYKILGFKLPKNSGGTDLVVRKLDCAVIEAAHNIVKLSKLAKYDTVRSMFSEGGELYPGAGFRAESHIQLCVRNLNCIKAFFDPREKENGPWAW